MQVSGRQPSHDREGVPAAVFHRAPFKSGAQEQPRPEANGRSVGGLLLVVGKERPVRFGMSGWCLPADMDAVTPEMCERVRALGFSGIFTRFRANDPHSTPAARTHRLRDVLADNGVQLFQATGYW